MSGFLLSIRKALVSGVAAGATSYASGSTWPVAVAAGVAAGVLVWAVPNAGT